MDVEIKNPTPVVTPPPTYVVTFTEEEMRHLVGILGQTAGRGPSYMMYDKLSDALADGSPRVSYYSYRIRGMVLELDEDD